MTRNRCYVPCSLSYVLFVIVIVLDIMIYVVGVVVSDVEHLFFFDSLIGYADP